MKALILAAGYATRLYPLTKDFPKSLLAIGKKALIDYIIDKLEAIEEIDEIIVVTNSKFLSEFQDWAGSIKTKKQITLVDDLTRDYTQRRGAVGDMGFAIDAKDIKDDLLVIGGDNLFDSGLGDFLKFTQDKEPYPVIGIYDLKDKIAARNYGVINMNADNKITEFQEKPQSPKTTLVAMCLYYFSKAKLNLIKEYLEDKGAKRDATGFYIDWLKNKDPVYGFVFGGRWFDIGQRKFYNQAKQKFAQEGRKA